MRSTLLCLLVLHAVPAMAAKPIVVPLDGEARAQLTRTVVEAKAHGKALSCEGVALSDLLRKAGAMPAEKLPSEMLDHYVVVVARDGYRVTYSLAELDPATGNRLVYVIDRCAGKELDLEDGPLRLLTPADQRPARWVRQVETITVYDPE